MQYIIVIKEQNKKPVIAIILNDAGKEVQRIRKEFIEDAEKEAKQICEKSCVGVGDRGVDGASVHPIRLRPRVRMVGR